MCRNLKYKCEINIGCYFLFFKKKLVGVFDSFQCSKKISKSYSKQ